MSATQQAKNFAETQKWGTWSQEKPFKPEHFKTGDVFSMNGHVWICLGKCEDGSLVILHSTPSDSINGQGGGGVQINGVGDSENCQAVKLAEKYMSQYYPQWWERYHKVYKSFDSYTKYSGKDAGKFSWDLKNTLADPDAMPIRKLTRSWPTCSRVSQSPSRPWKPSIWALRIMVL
mgnify:CR=1 FL=1